MATLLWTAEGSIRSKCHLLPHPLRPIVEHLPDEQKLNALPDKFPLLLSKKNELVEPFQAYLYEVAVVSGKTQSRRTLTTYAESLLDWFQYLERVGQCWDEIDDEVVALYRNSMLGRDALSSKKLSATTVNIRVRTVIRFYRWLVSNQFLDEYPLFNDSTLPLREFHRFPRLLSRQELATLMDSCPEPYNLMVKWMACTGLRRSQVCSLSLEQIENSSNIDPRVHHFREIEVRRKGDGTQRVMVPIGLVEETNWYIATTRALTLNRNARIIRKSVSSGPVFLTSIATAVSPHQLGRTFRYAAKATGITATCHHLRHTFAICMLLLLEREAAKGVAINPLKTLQVLLSHRSITTTEIYLQALDVYSRSVKKSLEYLYGARP